MAASQATFNRRIHLKEDIPPPSSASCEQVPQAFEALWEDVNLRDCQEVGLPLLLLASERAVLHVTEVKEGIWRYCFFFNNRWFSIQAVAHEQPWPSLPPTPNNLLTEKGSLLHCPQEKLILRLSADGYILGGAKYYVER